MIYSEVHFLKGGIDLIDKLYIADVPSDYHFVRYNGDTFDLFSTDNPTGTTIFYRFYPKMGVGFYSENTTNITGDISDDIFDVQVSNSFLSRPDSSNILTSFLIICIFCCIIFNIFTSVVKRGGVLSGLL